MTAPRQSRTLYMLLGALLILLPLLAILQYRWIGEVTQAERRQLEDRVNLAGQQFAADFDRELIRVLSPFQLNGGLERPDLDDWFAEKHDEAAGAYPNLVQGVFLARRSESGISLSQFNPKSRALESVEWPTELTALHENLEQRFDRSRQRPPAPGDLLSGGAAAFAIPALDDGPRRGGPDFRGGGPPPGRGFRGPPPGPRPGGPFGGWTIVELNEKVLLEEFVPSLVARHFSSSSNADYRIAIRSRATPPQTIYKSDASFTDQEMQTPDFRIPLFRPEGGRGRGGGGPGPGGPGGGQRGQIGPAAFAGLGGSWELLVQHRSGSLDTAIGSLRRRNLAISFGILILLASSVAMVVVSSHRAKALAHLQMDFVARVSHELRTPLAIIRSAAYNLATGVVSSEDEVREYASMVQNEGQRLTTMVDQILTFSRTESGAHTYNVRPVDVSEIVDRVVGLMNSALSQSGCEIDRKIASNLPKVRADERALTECLQNLINNAMKYGRNGTSTRIQIEARTESNMVTLTVADSGPGIEPSDLPHVFDPFFRGKNARSDTPGSGLGLNLVSRMMTAQGGRVTVESEPGRGARFTLHLMIASETTS